MVKFKMKIALSLCLVASLTITLTIILYLSFDFQFSLPDFRRKSSSAIYYFIREATTVEKDDDFLRTRLIRNPVSANYYDFRKPKQLVFTNLSSNFNLYLKNGAKIDNLVQNKLDVFRFRRETMLSQCTKLYKPLSELKLENLEHVLVDTKTKLLFCYVPKVACTNWKRMLLLLSGEYQNYTEVLNLHASQIHARNLFKSLQNYTHDEAEYFIRNFRKVIFVRNPLERLLSAYINKFEQRYNSSKYFQSRFGKLIVKKFRNNPANQSLLYGDDVTFAEFITYLVSSNEDSYNEHWQQINRLCQPCTIQYDIIGKYETLLSDSTAVLRMLGFGHYLFPKLSKPSKTASSLSYYYGQLRPELLTSLYNIYQSDFRLFRYDFSTVNDFFENSVE